MPRLPIITKESTLSEEQQRVLDDLLGSRGGVIPGPYRFVLHTPGLAAKWAPLGEHLRQKSSLSQRVQELIITIAARQWDSDYIFNSHAPRAVKNGIAQSAVDAMMRNAVPSFEQEDEQVLYDYCTQLYRNKAVDEDTYQHALRLFGIQGIIELTATLGYYAMICFTLNAHQIPLAKDALRLQR